MFLRSLYLIIRFLHKLSFVYFVRVVQVCAKKDKQRIANYAMHITVQGLSELKITVIVQFVNTHRVNLYMANSTRPGNRR
jgi:hypothetical protein